MLVRHFIFAGVSQFSQSNSYDIGSSKTINIVSLYSSRIRVVGHDRPSQVAAQDLVELGTHLTPNAVKGDVALEAHFGAAKFDVVGKGHGAECYARLNTKSSGDPSQQHRLVERVVLDDDVGMVAGQEIVKVRVFL